MSKTRFRAAIRVVLSFALASAVTLTSVTASNESKKAAFESPIPSAGKSLLDAPIGRLMGTGHLSVDGYEAQAGATILSGSTVATGQDGYATVDLNSLGHIILQPNTAIRLTLSTRKVEVSLESLGSMTQTLPEGVSTRVLVRSGLTRLSVARGEVKANTDRKARTFAVGEVGTFNQALEVSASGETIFTVDGNTVNDSPDQPDNSGGHSSSNNTPKPKGGGGGGGSSTGLISVIGLTGAATAITVGVLRSGGNSSSSTAPRPSRVVP